MNVLNWSLLFLVIALIASLLGFSGIARASAWASGTFLLLFLVLALLSLILNVAKRARE